jgi:hypothetical protein
MMENFLTISKLYCSADENVVIAMTPPLQKAVKIRKPKYAEKISPAL